jgi:hypothetical protein
MPPDFYGFVPPATNHAAYPAMGHYFADDAIIADAPPADRHQNFLKQSVLATAFMALQSRIFVEPDESLFIIITYAFLLVHATFQNALFLLSTP